jgi:hypothetical protein
VSFAQEGGAGVSSCHWRWPSPIPYCSACGVGNAAKVRSAEGRDNFLDVLVKAQNSQQKYVFPRIDAGECAAVELSPHQRLDWRSGLGSRRMGSFPSCCAEVLLGSAIWSKSYQHVHPDILGIARPRIGSLRQSGRRSYAVTAVIIGGVLCRRTAHGIEWQIPEAVGHVCWYSCVEYWRSACVGSVRQ